MENAEALDGTKIVPQPLQTTQNALREFAPELPVPENWLNQRFVRRSLSPPSSGRTRLSHIESPWTLVARAAFRSMLTKKTRQRRTRILGNGKTRQRLTNPQVRHAYFR